MKALKIVPAVLVLLSFLFAGSTTAQDLEIYKFIGKPLTQVIQHYGKPVHQDKSNPAMVCSFYQTNTYRYVFVSNQKGVYQAEGNVSFSSSGSATQTITELIGELQSAGFESDTVGVGDYNLLGPGVKLNITLFENSYSKKYEVKIKANKSES
jgi:hypothetical protein